MDQPIVIGPTADAVEPGLEQLKLAVAEFGVEFLQQEDGGNFFFQHSAGKKVISYLDEKVEPVFFPYRAAKTDGRVA